MRTINLEDRPWRTEHSWVSPYNFDRTTSDKKVLLHDSTLRDGEQSAGIVFSRSQKVEIAKRLNDAGIPMIEAGFPAVSESDSKALSEICNLDLDAKITCLCRAIPEDIKIAAECGVWGVIIEVPVGYPRIKYQFGWDEETVIQKAMAAIETAKELQLNIDLFLIDTFRAEIKFLERIVTTFQDQVDNITLVDTLGCANPQAVHFITGHTKELVSTPLAIHCHNDFGMAVANSMTALANGAQIASCTLFGLGQRAGNASTEQLALASEWLYGWNTGIDTQQLMEVTEYVRNITGTTFPPYQPVIGSHLFTWEAGIPVAALAKLPLTVEPITPEILGRDHHVLLGKKSGKASITWKLKELNLPELTDEQITELLNKVKQQSITTGSTIDNNTFISMFEEVYV